MLIGEFPAASQPDFHGCLFQQSERRDSDPNAVHLHRTSAQQSCINSKYRHFGNLTTIVALWLNIDIFKDTDGIIRLAISHPYHRIIQIIDVLRLSQVKPACQNL
jgi:hypothetical protein